MSAAPSRPAPEFVVEADDWIDQLTGAFRGEFLATIRDLGISSLQKFPPRKEGVPFGHEVRVFRKFLRGGNSLFDPSGIAGLYRAFGTDRQRQLYRGFILGKALPEAAWTDLLGAKTLAAWREHHLLRESPEGLWCRFHVFRIGRLLLIGDQLRTWLLRRVLIGQDSYNMASFMDSLPQERLRRYLDVGPGSGVILATVCPRADEAYGMDINPRAVAISRLNVELNGITNCTVILQNALEATGTHGVFDLITWNSPFIFLPEDHRDSHYDSYGGHLGMEVIFAFMRVMPGLWSDRGKAYLAASAPISKTGENILERELATLGREVGLDFVVHVLQAYWNSAYWQLQEAHGIDRFELVHLEITRGTGRVRRVDPPVATRVVDRIRGAAYRAPRGRR